MFSFHDDIVYFSHCKGTTYKIPQFPKRHESARTCELLRVNYLWMISNVACPTAPRLRFSFL